MIHEGELPVSAIPAMGEMSFSVRLAVVDHYSLFSRQPKVSIRSEEPYDIAFNRQLCCKTYSSQTVTRVAAKVVAKAPRDILFVCLSMFY